MSPFDVTPLSVTAVSQSHAVWKPLVRRLKTSAVGGYTAASALVYVCGDRREEQRLLSPLQQVYRARLSARTGEPLFPVWVMGGLTVYSLGRLDARCQFLDERDGERSAYLAGVGYKAVRVHQSLINPNRMARYLCEVIEADSATLSQPASAATLQSPMLPHSRLLFRLTCSDCPDAPLVALSAHALWSTVSGVIFDITDAPLASRRNGGSNGWERFGLSHPLVRWMMEKQPGAEQCTAYRSQGPITVQPYLVDE